MNVVLSEQILFEFTRGTNSRRIRLFHIWLQSKFRQKIHDKLLEFFHLSISLFFYYNRTRNNLPGLCRCRIFGEANASQAKRPYGPYETQASKMSNHRAAFLQCHKRNEPLIKHADGYGTEAGSRCSSDRETRCR